ncbi:MAG: hypothetical protein FJZ57_00130 [Chlamydiae bacterium]|nr:hypothetical protein [Chlamydiota bacterium]
MSSHTPRSSSSKIPSCTQFASYGNPCQIGIPSEAPLSEVILDDRQQAEVEGLFGRVVYIKHKSSNHLYAARSAVDVVNAFVQSCADCLFFISGDPLVEKEVSKRAERLCVAPCRVTLRGSVNTALMLGEEVKSDLDVVLKSCRFHPSLSIPNFFRFFCSVLGLRALEIMNPDIPYEQSWVWRGENGCIYTHERAQNIIGLTHGVYKAFSPLFEQSKCIYSFSGLIDAQGKPTGIDLDIAVQFPMEQGFATSRSISPYNGSLSSSGSDRSCGSEEASFQSIDAMSFGHDAVELVLNTLAGKIDFKMRPYFSTLFDWNFSEVKKLVKNRELVVLDPNMFQGYKRLFYEITRGKFPKIDSLVYHRDNEKICYILLNMPERAYVIDSSPSHPLFDFINQKGQTPEFKLAVYFNTYKTAKLLLKQLEMNAESFRDLTEKKEKLSCLAALMNNQFSHPSWQSIFPKYCDALVRTKIPLDIIDDCYTVLSHIVVASDTRVGSCFGLNVRMTAISDSSKGFVFSEQSSSAEVIEAACRLRSCLPSAVFEELVGIYLKRYAELGICFEDMILLSYMEARFAQSLLTPYEIDEVITQMPRFLSLWMGNHSAFGDTLNHDVLKIIQDYQLKFFPSDSDREHFFHLISQDMASIENDSSLLPSYLIVMMKVSLLNRIDKINIAYGSLASLFKSKKCLETYHILSYLNDLAPHLENAQLLEIFDLVSELFDLKESSPLADKQKACMKELIRTIADRGMIRQVLIYLPAFAQLYETPVLELVLKNKELLFEIDNPVSVFTKILTIAPEGYIQDLLLINPEKTIEYLATYIRQEDCVSLDLLKDVITTSEQKKLFLTTISWAVSLAEKDPSFVVSMFLHLKGQSQRNEVPIFLRSLADVFPQLALDCLSETKPSMQSNVIQSDPLFWSRCIEKGLKQIPTDNLKHYMESILLSPHDGALEESLSASLLDGIVSVIQRDSDQAVVVNTYLERFLPVLCVLRQKKQLDVGSYLSLITSFIGSPMQKSLSSEIVELLHSETFDLANQKMDLLSFLHVAQNKTLSAEICAQVMNKVKEVPLTTQIYLKVYDLFRSRPDLRKELLIEGYKAKIDTEVLRPSILESMELLSSFSAQMDNLWDMTQRGLPSDLILSQIDKIRIDGSITASMRPQVKQCLQGLLQTDLCCVKKFLSLCSTSTSLGIDKHNYMMLLEFLLQQDSTLLQEIVPLLKVMEVVSHSDYLSLMRHSVASGKELVVFKQFNKIEISDSFIEVLNVLLERIDKSVNTLKTETPLYKAIDEQIKRIEHSDFVSSLEAFHGLYDRFMTVYLGKIMTHDPDAILRFMDKADRDVFSLKLADMIVNSRDLSSTLLTALFEMIESKEELVHFEPLKGSLLSCYRFYFENAKKEDLFPRIMQCYNLLGSESIEVLASILIRKSLLNKDYSTAKWVAERKGNCFSAADGEVKKNNLRSDLMAILKSTTPDAAADVFSICWMLRKEIGSKVKSHLIQLAQLQLKQPLSQISLDQAKVIYQKFVLSGEFTFSAEEIALLSKVYDQHFEKIDLELYKQNLDFFRARKYPDFMYSCANKLFAKHCRVLWHSLCLKEAPSAENIKSIEIFKDLFAEANIVVIPLLSDLIGVCREGVHHLLDKEQISDQDLDHMVAISGMFCLIASFDQSELSKASTMLNRVIDKGVIERFTQNFSAFMAFNYLILSKQCSRGDILEIVSCALYSLPIDSLESKERQQMQMVILDFLIPVFLSTNPDGIDFDSIFHLLKMYGPIRKIDDNQMETVLKLVLLNMTQVTAYEPKSLGTEKDYNTPYSLSVESTEILMRFFCDNINPTMPIDLLSKIGSTILCVAATSQFENPSVLIPAIDNIERIARINNEDETIERNTGYFLSEIMLNPTHVDLKRLGLFAPLKMMYVFIPNILQTARHIPNKPQSLVDQLDVIKGICLNFYVKMDKLVGCRGKTALEYSMYPYIAIDSYNMDSTAEVLGSAIEKIKTESRTDSILQYCRILMGFAFHYGKVREQYEMSVAHKDESKHTQLSVEYALVVFDEAILEGCLRCLRFKSGVSTAQMSEIVTLTVGSYTTNPQMATANLINLGLAIIPLLDKRTNLELDNLACLINGVYESHIHMEFIENLELILAEIKFALDKKYHQALLPKLSLGARACFKKIKEV